MSEDDALARVRDYHERTKHHLDRYARSMGYLDWATQPDPFRRFDGAAVFPLDLSEPGDVPSFDEVLAPGRVPPAAVDRHAVSQLLQDALALSAWKEFRGSRWSLRVNPSSGNLHPTEGYVVSGPVAGLTDHAGVFHYSPGLHALEERLALPDAVWRSLARDLPDGAFLVGLSSIHWREAWKYGERAFRYCQHDVGHAIGAVTIAAAALGWRVQLLEGVSDADIAALLGLDRQSGPEREHPYCLLAVQPSGAVAAEWSIPAEVTAFARTAPISGEPNTLSPGHQHWHVIDEVSEATEKSAPAAPFRASSGAAIELPVRGGSARRMIHQRRSAVDMDAQTSISRDSFHRMLARTTVAGNPLVFEALPWMPAVHLALFVHRVEGLAPGLYFLSRRSGAVDQLKEALRGDFLWTRPKECPAGLDLFCLVEADCRDAARTVSCQQSIASDGAFSLGMLAEFDASLERHGPWFYRRLFWETGLVGQVLYLEAEAAGVRATGIGCFFDDVMHSILGLEDHRYQSLYHFTVGGPVEDARLRTEPPYAHRAEALSARGAGT